MRKIRLLSLLLLLACGLLANADPQLDSLYLVVGLKPNGDAEVTEKRMMTIDSKNTEAFSAINNLDKDSHLKDFKVFDEHADKYYQYVSDWNALRTRSQKAKKCSIIETGDGNYELCWGLGHEGVREYWVSYTVTGLVRSFSDYDGLLYQFIAPGVTPLPRFVRMVIYDERRDFNPEWVRLWSYGCQVESECINGRIAAYVDGALKNNDYLTLVCRFEKGHFHPSLSTDAPFSVLQEKVDADNVSNTTAKQNEGPHFSLKKMVVYLAIFTIFVAVAVIFYIVYNNFRKRTSQSASPRFPPKHHSSSYPPSNTSSR
ncbi:MAG: DUF2207 domain-containing protein [Prevotella sp.]|nr:DUF2207 domain-containing protein [Prevotella sp.]